MAEELYVNKQIQDYQEMTIVCENDQVTGSLVKIGSQSFRSLGAHMEQSPTSATVGIDNQTKGSMILMVLHQVNVLVMI